jgi:cellobiose phosphorylase
MLDGLYQHCQNFEISRIYPCLPEYVSPRGRGLYPYLTGAASWYLLTLVTEVFGVKGQRGDLRLSPKLVPAQFDTTGQVGVTTLFAGKSLTVVYHNPAGLNHDRYQIEAVKLDGAVVAFEREGPAVVIARQTIAALNADQPHVLEVALTLKA